MLTNCVGITTSELFTLLASQNSTTASVYPNLSKLAQTFLALSIGTADSERGFLTM